MSLIRVSQLIDRIVSGVSARQRACLLCEAYFAESIESFVLRSRRVAPQADFAPLARLDQAEVDSRSSLMLVRYALRAHLATATGWTFMNHGFIADDAYTDTEDVLYSLATDNCRDFPGDEIFDVGCGNGSGSAMLAARLPQSSVLGIDITVKSIENARRAHPGLENLRFGVHDGQHPPSSCDVAIYIESAHAMGGYDALIARSPSVMRPGGRVVVADAVSSPELIRIRKSLQHEQSHGDFRVLTDGVVRSLRTRLEMTTRRMVDEPDDMIRLVLNRVEIPRLLHRIDAFESGKLQYYFAKITV